MSLAVSPTLLVHLGFALSALGFLVRDILWLRLLAMGGYTVFTVFAFTRAEGPAWNFLVWYAAFLTINGGHAAWLIYERQLVRLNDEECRLRDRAFRALDPFAVKRLMRAGTWLDLPPGEMLTRKDRRVRQLVLIAAGEAVVSDEHRVITRLGPGHFVGEIAFLRNSGASATTSVRSSRQGPRLRCLAWDQRALRRRLERDEAMRTTLYAAIGVDLATKITLDNIRVTQGGDPERDRAERA